MPNIIGEPFKKYVAQQINTRQKAHGSGTNGNPRTPEYLSYLNSKTSWVKLASGVAISEQSNLTKNFRSDLVEWDNLAKKNVLFSGTSALGASYLNQRGNYSDANNIWDYYKGTYNVSPTTQKDGDTGEYGLAPMPGITGVEIKCLNRGSIKRAEVTIKCYTPDQFRIIDILYLRLGYTMFLEWGWSPYLDNNGKLVSNYTTLIESPNGFFSNKWKNKSYSAFLPAIEAYRKSKNGNYDGLLCKVVNFSWVFAQDGSYDITLSLISLGDIVESLKINVPPSRQVNKFINQSYVLYNNNESETTGDADILPSPADNIISSYLFLQKLYLDEENNGGTQGKNEDERADVDNCEVYCTVQGNRIPLAGHFVIPPDNGAFELPPVYDSSPTFDTKKEAEDWIKSAAGGAYASHKQVDVTSILGSAGGDAESLLEDQTGNCYTIYEDLFIIDASGEGTGGFFQYTVLVKSTPSIKIEDTNQKKKDVVYLNYNNGEDSSEFINDSGFYMRLGHLLEFIRNFVIPKIEGTNRPIVELDYGQWSNVMYTMPFQVSFDPRVCIVNSGEKINTKDFFPTLEGWKKEKNGYAWIMNIYVSHNQILQSLSNNADEKGNVALFDFLQNICDAINKAMGGINNLEVVLDEEINTLKIIDGSYTPEIKNDYTLELYGYNSTNSTFVKNFTLKTEITNDFATMATIGSTAGGYVKGTENTMFSKWNRGLVDRWKEKIVPGDKASRENSGEVAEPNEEFVENIWKQRISAFGYTKLDIEGYAFDPINGLFGSGDFGDWSTFGDSCGLSDEIIDKNVTIATEFFKWSQSELQKQNPNYGAPTPGFVPINLSITMEGLSGIKIYNALNVSTKFLPQNYPDALKFIIKGVNHSIKDNVWETTIETVTIAQNQE